MGIKPGTLTLLDQAQWRVAAKHHHPHPLEAYKRRAELAEVDRLGGKAFQGRVRVVSRAGVPLRGQ